MIGQLIQFIILMAVFIIVDSIWIALFIGGPFSKMVNDIQGSDLKINLIGAIISYALLIIGTYQFGLSKIDEEKPFSSALLSAGLFGLLSYGIFDFTNLALFNKYSWTLALVDTMWGGVVCFLSAIITFYLSKLIKV